jgi:cytochrome c oxidase subunit II
MQAARGAPATAATADRSADHHGYDPAALAPRRPGYRRPLAALLVLGALAALLVAAPAALADVLTPEDRGGSREAERIDVLFEITLWLALPIFALVEGVLIYALVRHRFRRGAPEPAQIRGNTRLELSWTVAATLLLVVITAITFVFLPGIRDPERGGQPHAGAVQVAATGQPPVPGGSTMNIRVVGQQYVWRYDYPGPGRLFSYGTMVVPTNTTITLDITSADVIHSFWIPELFGKADAVPGHVNDMWFNVTQEGTYRGNCAELCGENHAQMVGHVKAVSPAQYRAWADRQRRDIAAAATALAEQRRRFQPSGGGSQVPQ